MLDGRQGPRVFLFYVWASQTTAKIVTPVLNSAYTFHDAV